MICQRNPISAVFRRPNLRVLLLVSVVLCCGINFLNAKSLLINNKEIWNGLLEISVANKISEDCKLIDARKIKGFMVLLEIKNTARNMGYTSEEIGEFVNSKINRESLLQQTNEYLIDNGVDLNQSNTICSYGLSEIDDKSRIGALLRIKK